MGVVWLPVFGLLALALVRRHGWEYVPLVVLLAASRGYAETQQIGALGDGLALVGMSAIWVVSGITGERNSER